jgi:hypothetical protein
MAALILGFVALLIPLLSPRLRGNPNLAQAVFLVALAHQVVSLLHVTIGPLPTVDVDAHGFDLGARMGGTRHQQMFYGRLLYFTYDFFGASTLLGCQVSQVAFSVGLLAFVEIIFLLEVQSQAAKLVLIFGILPSCMLNTSVTTREAFQQCCFLGLAYVLLNLRKNGVTRSLALLPVFAGGLVLFHNGLGVFVILVVPMGIFWGTGSRPQMVVAAAAATFVVLFLFGGTIWKSMKEQSPALHRIASGEGVEYINTYATQVLESRTDFDTNIDVSSVGSALTTVPVVLVYYLFAPLPWQVSSARDIVGFAESCLRIFLFCSAIHGIRKATGETRKMRLFLFLCFLILETLWAAGTANVGTAVRHRVVAWGALVLAGGAGWINRPPSEPTKDFNTKSSNSLRARIRERRRKALQARPFVGER